MAGNSPDQTSISSPKVSAARAAILRVEADPERLAMMEARLQRAAARLKELYSHKPFYQRKVEKFGEDFWRGWARSAVNVL